MAYAISILALLATFYQLYLQRVHNEKSLRPLAQIDLTDRGKVLHVHIENNGVGPLIIEKLTFIKNGEIYSDIEPCLDIDPRTYQHIPITELVKKVILPGSYLEVFSMEFSKSETDQDMNKIREKLAPLMLKVEGRDIYDNKVYVERALHWFIRYQAA